MIDPARRAYLLQKYVAEPPPGAIAAGEQLSQAVLDARREVEKHNAALGLDWLNWRTPPAIGMRCDEYMNRLREAEARQSRDPASTFVHYYDDRNSYDVRNGWVEYDPDCPGHQNVPLGHIIADRKSTMTVHVLRAGTEPLFDSRDHLSTRERPADRVAPHKELPNYGSDFDVETFLAHAKHDSITWFCDLRLDETCAPHGLGGGRPNLIAIAQGRHIFAINACTMCLRAAEPCGCGDCDGYSEHS